MNRSLMQIYSLWLRDMKHLFRSPARVLGIIGQPVIGWLFLGGGFAKNEIPGATLSYSDYLFPGVVVLMILFSAIYSTISLIEDRRDGFLQGVLASPVPRGSIVIAKMLAGATSALAQTGVFLLLLPFTGIAVTLQSVVLTLCAAAVIGMALTNLGFITAWKMKSTQAFHAIMNIVLLPLWMLSGAVFPPEGSAGWLRVLTAANPLHYVQSAFNAALYSGMDTAIPGTPFALAAAVSLLLFAALTITSFSFARR